MELELLMKSWAEVNKKLEDSASFNEKLIDKMIAVRAMTTLERIKTLYKSFYIVLTIELVFFVAIFFGNPFDFAYKIQFLPYALLFVGVIIAFINLIRLHLSINNLSPDLRIDRYLGSIVRLYELNKNYEKWFGTILFCVGLMVPFSFLPQKIDRMGISGAVVDTLIMISSSLVLFFLAYRLGAFKHPYKSRLENDLAEWNELKALATGLKGRSE